jgi:Transcription factor WhiB
MTTAIDRPLARPLDVVNDNADKPTRALCASDPALFDYDKSTPPEQVEKARRVCFSCPLFRRCAALLVILPDAQLPRGTVMASVAIPWYKPLNRSARWRRAFRWTVERYASPE